jgi:hypothetical protein
LCPGWIDSFKIINMKKLVLVSGIIAGAIPAIWFLIYKGIGDPDHFENGVYYGYASMILAFSLIFVAVKNYRDKQNGGVISFGKAFRIGLYITLIASAVYVLAWLVNYYYFDSDYLDKYNEYIIQKMKSENASQVAIDKQIADTKEFMELYQNPFFNGLLTFSEIFPVGLIISLITALILKRKAP